METNGKKVLDLRSIQNAIAGKIELNDGVHDVRKLNAEQYQIMLQPVLNPEENIARAVRLVLECVPTLPEAQVRQFDPDLLMAIVTLASQGIKAVRDAFPNVESPEPPNSTSPG